MSKMNEMHAMNQTGAWRDAKNILAVRLDNIGDVIMLGPALRALKETSPTARITLLASRAGAAAATLLPWIDDVMVWRPVWQDVGNHLPFDPLRELKQITELAARRFDAALIFTSFSQTPHVPGYVCYLAGIPLRAGESKEFGGSTLTNELRGAPDEMHQAERNLRLVEQLGYAAHDRQLAVVIPAEAQTAVTALLTDAGIHEDEPYILLHPGASAAARRYPAERYAAVTRELAARGWRVVVTGTDRERLLVERVTCEVDGAVALVGATTLPEYAALVERATLVICNDTLPMHLADATRTPEVVLFAGTEYEEQWRPRAAPSRLLRRPTPCQPCYLFDCPIGLRCLDIAPLEVVQAVEAMLGVTPPQPADQTLPPQTALTPAHGGSR